MQYDFSKNSIEYIECIGSANDVVSFVFRFSNDSTSTMRCFDGEME